MSLLTRRHDPDEYDGRDVDDDGDGVLDEGVDGVDGVGDSAEDAEDAEDEDGGWWIFDCSRREVVELLVVTVVIVVVSAALGTGLYQLFGRPDREEWARPGETSPAVAHSHQAQESATPTPTASLSAQEQALRDAARNTPKPERPAGMDQNTPEGAIATAEYLLSLYPYVYATGDLEPWYQYCPQATTLCDSVAALVTDLHSSGGWADSWGQEVLSRQYSLPTDESPGTGVRLTLQSEPVTLHDADGAIRSHEVPEQEVFTSYYVWTGTQWTLTDGDFTS